VRAEKVEQILLGASETQRLSSEVQSKNKQISELTKQLETVRKSQPVTGEDQEDSSQKSEWISELEKQKLELGTIVSHLQKEQQGLAQKNEELEKERNELLHNVTELKEANQSLQQSLESANQNSQETITELRKDNSVLVATKIEMGQTIDTLTSELAQLKLQLQSAQTTPSPTSQPSQPTYQPIPQSTSPPIPQPTPQKNSNLSDTHTSPSDSNVDSSDSSDPQSDSTQLVSKSTPTPSRKLSGRMSSGLKQKIAERNNDTINEDQNKDDDLYQDDDEGKSIKNRLRSFTREMSQASLAITAELDDAFTRSSSSFSPLNPLKDSPLMAPTSPPQVPSELKSGPSTYTTKQTPTWQHWGVTEVSKWLREKGLERFIEIFSECECQGEDLELIGDQDLREEFEIEKASDRALILSAIQGLIKGSK